MAISAYILKIAGKDPFRKLQMRAKEDFYIKTIGQTQADNFMSHGL